MIKHIWVLGRRNCGDRKMNPVSGGCASVDIGDGILYRKRPRAVEVRRRVSHAGRGFFTKPARPKVSSIKTSASGKSILQTGSIRQLWAKPPLDLDHMTTVKRGLAGNAVDQPLTRGARIEADSPVVNTCHRELLDPDFEL